jgi:hypothetical protein
MTDESSFWWVAVGLLIFLAGVVLFKYFRALGGALGFIGLIVFFVSLYLNGDKIKKWIKDYFSSQ